MLTATAEPVAEEAPPVPPVSAGCPGPERAALASPASPARCGCPGAASASTSSPAPSPPFGTFRGGASGWEVCNLRTLDAFAALRSSVAAAPGCPLPSRRCPCPPTSTAEPVAVEMTGAETGGCSSAAGGCPAPPSVGPLARVVAALRCAEHTEVFSSSSCFASGGSSCAWVRSGNQEVKRRAGKRNPCLFLRCRCLLNNDIGARRSDANWGG